MRTIFWSENMKGRSNVEKEITLEGMLEKLCVRLCTKFTWLNIVVSTAMDFRGSDVRDSNPGRVNGFFSSPKHQRRLWGPPNLLLNGYRGPVLGVKRLERCVDHCFLSIAYVKNEWSYTSTPSLCLHGLDRGNIYFIVTGDVCGIINDH